MGKIAVADIDWQGTIQKGLMAYCDTEDIVGYYNRSSQCTFEKFMKAL